MRRAYILVYVLVIVSLLFMVVVKITDFSLGSQTVEISLKDNLISKYAYESAGHMAINEFKNRGWFDKKLYEASKKDGKIKDVYMIELDDLRENQAYLSADRGYASISIGDQYSIYRLLVSLRLYDDFYYTNDLVMDYGSDSYEGIFNGPYLDIFEKDVLSLNKKLITSSNKILSYSSLPKEDKEINKEEINEAKPSGLYNLAKHPALTNSLFLEGPDSDRNYSGNYEPGKLGEKEPTNLETKPPAKDSDQDFINQENPSSQEPLFETDLVTEDDILIEVSEEENEKNHENTENSIDKTESEYELEDETEQPVQVSKDQFLIFGPENIYDLKDKIPTQGIIYIGEETEIKANIEHHGLAIVTGKPKIDKGRLVVIGGLVDKDGIYKDIDKLEFRPNKEAVMKSLAIYKGFYKVKITSFTIK